jgi:hypothetical protein
MIPQLERKMRGTNGYPPPLAPNLAPLASSRENSFFRVGVRTPGRVGQDLRTKTLSVYFGHPYGYNSYRCRLGRDNRRKLFRKTNNANAVAGALHPVVARSGLDSDDLLTFSDARELAVAAARMSNLKLGSNQFRKEGIPRDRPSSDQGVSIETAAKLFKVGTANASHQSKYWSLVIASVIRPIPLRIASAINKALKIVMVLWSLNSPAKCFACSRSSSVLGSGFGISAKLTRLARSPEAPCVCAL